LKTINDMILMQPNNVTFGQYELSAIQENLLTLAMDALQKHASKEKLIATDLWGQPTINVSCDEAAGQNNKSLVKTAVKDMMKKTFAFKWTHPNMGKVVETGGVIFTTWHDIKGTNQIAITINVWAIPFLVYYGVGVGGTQFNKSIALNLQGEYTKRLYKMVCRWKDELSFTYPIEQLRSDLEIPRSYTNSHIEERVLKASEERIKESGSDVWFEYELLCKYPKKGRKPKADTIIFKIFTKTPLANGGEQSNLYKTVYHWLCKIWDSLESSKAREVSDKLSEIGGLQKVSDRIIYYESQIINADLTLEHAKNKLKKMLKEEYGISTEVFRKKK
jgi:Initiator Replication protein